jgi:hypothetical protein
MVRWHDTQAQGGTYQASHIVHSKPPQELLTVGVDRVLTELEQCSNLFGRAPFRNQLQDFTLAGRQEN